MSETKDEKADERLDACCIENHDVQALMRDAKRLLGEDPDTHADWGRCSLDEVEGALYALAWQASESRPSVEGEIVWLARELLLRLAAGRLDEGDPEARALAVRCEAMADHIDDALRRGCAVPRCAEDAFPADRIAFWWEDIKAAPWFDVTEVLGALSGEQTEAFFRRAMAVVCVPHLRGKMRFLLPAACAWLDADAVRDPDDFLVAHEVAHVVLGHAREPHGDEEREAAADELAASWGFPRAT